MADYRTMFDSNYLRCFHLAGKDLPVTIERVEQGDLVGEGGRKARKPVIYFKEQKLPLAINKTIGKVLARAWGNETAAWVGKALILYPAETTLGGETVECIRCRIPKEGK